MSLDFVQSYAPTPSRSAWRVSPNPYVPRRETFFTPRNEVLAAGPTMSRLPANADRKIASAEWLHDSATREAHRRPIANGQLPPGVDMILDFPRMRGPGSRPASIIDARALGTRQESDVMPSLAMTHHHQRVPHAQPRGINVDSRGGHMSERGASDTMHPASTPSRFYTGTAALTVESDRPADERDVAPAMTNTSASRPGKLLLKKTGANAYHQQTDHASRERQVHAALGPNKGVKNVRFASEPTTFMTLTGHNESESRSEYALTSNGPVPKRRRIAANVTSIHSDQQKTDRVEKLRDDHSATGVVHSKVMGKLKTGAHSLARPDAVASSHKPNDEREKVHNVFTQKSNPINRARNNFFVNNASSDHVTTDRDRLATIAPAAKTQTRLGHTGSNTLRVEHVANNHAEKQREQAAPPATSRAVSKLLRPQHGVIDQATDRKKPPRDSVHGEMPPVSSTLKLQGKASGAATIVPSFSNKKTENLRDSLIYEMPTVSGALKLNNKPGSSAATVFPSMTNKSPEDTRDPVLLGLQGGASMMKAKAAFNHAVPATVNAQHQARDVNWVPHSSSSAQSSRLQTRPTPPTQQTARVSSHVEAVVPLARASASTTARATPGIALADDTRVSRGSVYGGTAIALPQQNPIKTPLRVEPAMVGRTVRTAQQHDSASMASMIYGSLLRKPNVSGVQEHRGNRASSLPGDVPRLAPLLKQ